MAASHLQCKECKAEYPLEALYVCERASARSRSPTTTAAPSGDVAELRRRIQGGPQNIWRYADFLPLAGGPPGPLRPAAPRASACRPAARR